jgi:hypothetical protein
MHVQIFEIDSEDEDLIYTFGTTNENAHQVSLTQDGYKLQIGSANEKINHDFVCALYTQLKYRSLLKAPSKSIEELVCGLSNLPTIIDSNLNPLLISTHDKSAGNTNQIWTSVVDRVEMECDLESGKILRSWLKTRIKVQSDIGEDCLVRMRLCNGPRRRLADRLVVASDNDDDADETVLEWSNMTSIQPITFMQPAEKCFVVFVKKDTEKVTVSLKCLLAHSVHCENVCVSTTIPSDSYVSSSAHMSGERVLYDRSSGILDWHIPLIMGQRTHSLDLRMKNPVFQDGIIVRFGLNHQLSNIKITSIDIESTLLIRKWNKSHVENSYIRFSYLFFFENKMEEYFGQVEREELTVEARLKKARELAPSLITKLKTPIDVNTLPPSSLASLILL